MLARALLVAGVLALGACSGEESDPQPQSPALRTEATGIITDGVALRAQSVAGKGAEGLTRTSNSTSSGTYTLTLTELKGPYIFANTLVPGGDPGLIVLTTVSTGAGVTNLTPLTTLLTAQLLGTDPGNAFATFTSSTTVPKEKITDAGIQAAQAELTAFLQDVLGVQVKSGTASFVTSSFNAAPGDAMFDTMLALNAKLAADGTTLKALGSRIATGVQACNAEQVQVTVNGQKKKFCPVNKGAVPEEADPSIVDYVFRSVADEVLAVKARDTTVLTVGFTASNGVTTYSCAGAACTSLTVSAKAGDDTRSIAFTSTPLAGGGGSVLIDGTLVGPPPSITLPTLPCTDNRYFLILSTNTVIADCISPDDPFQIGGTFANASGPGRESVSFANTDDPLPTHPGVSVVIDTSTPEPTVVSVYFKEIDPDTFEIHNRYLCRLAACNGATVGPATTTMAPGVLTEIRTVTFNNTLLTGLDGDGAPTGATGSFRGSFVLLRVPSFGVSYPDLMDCDPLVDTVSVTTYNGGEFNLCMPPNDPNIPFFLYRQTFDLGNGEFNIVMSNDFSDQIFVNLQANALSEVRVQISGSGEQFRCTTDCAGVTVSDPDGAGERTISFSNAVLHHIETYPLAGDRTVTLTSGDLVVPPP